MSLCVRLGFVVLWIASLFFAAALVRAQTRMMTPLPTPIVVSGGDVGFRIDGHIGNAPAGTIVIRVNGEWVAPVTPSGPARLANNR